MDFSKFDSRAQAEAGFDMQIVDEWTGEPMMDGDKPCMVIVRGASSPTMQAKMRAAQKAAMMSEKAKGKDEDDGPLVMEDTHKQLCESAAGFIMGFKNVNRGDVPATADDALWFLDLTFPVMGLKERDDDVQEFEMKNTPFAIQVATSAGGQAKHMGNSKRG
jgi:hypothetical protein